MANAPPGTKSMPGAGATCDPSSSWLASPRSPRRARPLLSRHRACARGRQCGHDPRVERRPLTASDGSLDRVLPTLPVEDERERRAASNRRRAARTARKRRSRALERACRQRGQSRVPSTHSAPTLDTFARSRAACVASRLRPHSAIKPRSTGLSVPPLTIPVGDDITCEGCAETGGSADEPFTLPERPTQQARL
jgi:hypothetical protein